jgi:hypothetical protein
MAAGGERRGSKPQLAVRRRNQQPAPLRISAGPSALSRMDEVERLQRQRKGENVPAPLNVNLGRRA